MIINLEKRKKMCLLQRAVMPSDVEHQGLCYPCVFVTLQADTFFHLITSMFRVPPRFNSTGKI